MNGRLVRREGRVKKKKISGKKEELWKFSIEIRKDSYLRGKRNFNLDALESVTMRRGNCIYIVFFAMKNWELKTVRQR